MSWFKNENFLRIFCLNPVFHYECGVTYIAINRYTYTFHIIRKDKGILYVNCVNYLH